MAYTMEQKNTIMNKVIEYLQANQTQFYTSRELVLALELDLRPAELTRMAQDIETRNTNISRELWANAYHYSYNDINKIFHVVDNGTKERNLIIFKDDNKTLMFDLNTKTFTNQEDYVKIVSNSWNMYRYLTSYMNSINEWVLTYYYQKEIEVDIECAFMETMATCPKGYINYLKDNSLELNEDTYQQYNLSVKLSRLNLSRVKLENVYNLLNCFGNDSYYSETKSYLLDNLGLLEKIEKMKINDIKNGLYDNTMVRNSRFTNTYLNMREFIHMLSNNHQLINFIDTNRGYAYNCLTLYGLDNENKYTHLRENLQKLNFINGLEIGDYKVVVPQCAMDLIIEGQNQNNCVGSYYNDDINDNSKLVYFLRDKNDINKSVITCSWNVKYKNRCECRTKNNSNITTEQDNLIKQVEKIILENLYK